MKKAKPFAIPKKLVWEAYKRVRANKGSAGVDGQTIEAFERNVKGNLYKLWNRMSSGSYHPKAVKGVAIPKKSGGARVLGIPTVTDRIAQMVVVLYLEPKVNAEFHPDSYGFRPGVSAHDALSTASQRCTHYKYCIDLDIKNFFDSIDHQLLLHAVRKHTENRWVLLYIERWLKTPMYDEYGELIARQQGTPQGGVCSPLLSNIFLHHAFDEWFENRFERLSFERYADEGAPRMASW